MSVKKVAKKPSVKKVKKSTTKRASRPVAVAGEREVATVAAAAPLSDVFSTRAEEPGTVEVPANSVALFVNGNSKGIVNTSDILLKDFVTDHAGRAGIRSFSVYLDGAKATTADGGRSLHGFRKVEIVAKDSRG